MPVTSPERARKIVNDWRVRNPERHREQSRKAMRRHRMRQREAEAMVPAQPLVDVISDAAKRMSGITDQDDRGANFHRDNGGRERFVRVLAKAWGTGERTAWRRVARIEKAAASDGMVRRVTADEVCVAARTHPALVYGCAVWEAGRVE